MGPLSLGSLHRLFKQSGGVGKFKFGDGREQVGVLEVRSLDLLVLVFVLNFGVDPGLGLVVDPLAHKQLVFVAVEE